MEAARFQETGCRGDAGLLRLEPRRTMCRGGFEEWWCASLQTVGIGAGARSTRPPILSGVQPLAFRALAAFVTLALTLVVFCFSCCFVCFVAKEVPDIGYVLPTTTTSVYVSNSERSNECRCPLHLEILVGLLEELLPAWF